MKSLFLLIDSVINIYIWLIIINAILSWLVAFNVLNTQNRFVFAILNATHQLTDPVLNKIRKFIPNLGSIDISPVVLILLLFFIRNLFFELLAPNLF
ncbi:MAG: YggT family protein [Pelagibacteraceae bacterium]|jgi:YggT family protein|nr:YggT family protein [Pelagibacteraceae bacterium]|tara:strand:- start:941 stop:1231 length:291 start_codon:yes stop_codon:yes gene_type:complete